MVKLYYDKNNNLMFMCCHVPEFIEAESVPPNSLNLNPLDFLFWGALQQKLSVSSKHSETLII